MPRSSERKPARIYPDELKQQAVQMLEDGHSAAAIASRLGLPRTNLIYKWKERLQERGVATENSTAAAQRIRELEAELARVLRERDILKKALAILGRHES